ncbi:putative integral membrane protein (TIGR00698 family) [Dysgonomonas sp. PFB1-18]|uniref:YeiH family protein n=1 Tax=unclassified Dysgonomonas TaxID=2630389 RepID=UPI002476A073|nr:MULTISPECIES: putative sulfate exporter family transporter [unclassified Dysgonomonas]MDH6310807.1 putative integral membrane protein (TIGR00698 family) [Dysgonomonas sp. PF1-14]MDH6340657.1 putative integral membrane protein (TIGR00698 family) [Dysgonomonas sp. PF1-16]MDH6382236.1 putative integral membrane protein (TIGR00698 family) [Dysgonomonas sp. PFB1-18]MDH6399627.1 putative integral membrane protein (TIGR00698 family) [Dysgonomonas sp. PF1-23]
MQKILSKLYYIIPICCLFPFFSAPLALLLGILLAFFYKGDETLKTGRLTKYLLQGSIVCMGFAMSVHDVVQTGRTGFMITIVSVAVTMISGILLGRLFKVEKNTSMLISGGTAICGGSAIAAIAPVIDAKNNQISFSLAVIFVLNAVALFIFPAIGHLLNMDQTHFGYWAAIAIHDTSSVVGACSAYGEQALQVGTTVKLTRTLWIIPLALCIAFFNKNNTSRINIPWFIFLFVVAILIGNYIPGMEETNQHLSWLGKRGMMISLFFIGTSINIDEVKKTGVNTFMQGVLLWIIIAVLSYCWIQFFF